MRNRFSLFPPEPLEGRVVPASISLQGTLAGYLDNQTTTPASSGGDVVTSDMHFLGTMNTLGTAYGGGIEVDHVMTSVGVNNELITINGTGGSVTVQLSETAPRLPILTPAGSTPPSVAAGEVASYTILGGTGAYVGASGEGTGLLATGPSIQLPGTTGQAVPTFTLQFLQPVTLGGTLGGSGSVVVTGTGSADSVSSAVTTVTGSGAVTPMGQVVVSGSISAYLAGVTAVGYTGQIILTGTQGTLTLAVDGFQEIPQPGAGTGLPTAPGAFPTEAMLDYSVIGGSGIYQDLVGNGSLVVTLPSSPTPGVTAGTYTGSFSASLTPPDGPVLL